ncbi:hypothetical protein NUW54_g7644 [Trametes sanguinea]|uniref:Uncharacterized protein n=1 Tax=Trametes sanguinea TaxID=158606 RepID=A0ACC1PJY5_9APHY|nr:hypothetical protein NUW54_g7644 [Trametes sanguinea]
MVARRAPAAGDGRDRVMRQLDGDDLDARRVPALALPALDAHRAEAQQAHRAVALAHLDAVEDARARGLVRVLGVDVRRAARAGGFDSDVVDTHRRALNKARNDERKDSDTTIANNVAIAAGEAPDNGDERPVRQALFAWVDYIRTKMADYVVRRTTSSLDLNDKPIHKLHAIQRVPFVVVLRDDEMEVQHVLAEKLQGEGAKATKKNLELLLSTLCPRRAYAEVYATDRILHPAGCRHAVREWLDESALGTAVMAETTALRVSTVISASGVRAAQTISAAIATFYLGIRQALLHKFAPDLDGYQFPHDHQAIKYNDFPSTKINALLELLQHHRGKSCTPPAVIVHGHVVDSDLAARWPDWPTVPGAPIDKIIVYLAFPSQNWIVRKALREGDFEFEEIQGHATPAQRALTLKAFQSGRKQILLMSNVGTVGLNIAFANIVIIIDNLWSAQETEQLMGRVWRHPQEKKTIEYHVIADGTSDVFIGGISFDKGLVYIPR